MKKIILAVLVASLVLFATGCVDALQVAAIQASQRGIYNPNAHPPYPTWDEYQRAVCSANPYRPGCPNPPTDERWRERKSTTKKTERKSTSSMTPEEKVRLYCSQHPSDQDCRNLGY